MSSLAEDWRSCVRHPDSGVCWEHFLECQRGLLLRIVVRVANRFGVAQNGEIDDAIQECCLKLSIMARGKFIEANDDALAAYLKAAIANSAHDYFKSRFARRRNVFKTSSIDDAGSCPIPASNNQNLDRDILLREIEHIAGGSDREREVFLLYYRFGWTAREIAQIPALGLTTKGVESLVFRIVANLKDHIRSSPPPNRSMEDTS